MSDPKHVIIYTDGACQGNPGPGGYGAVLLYGEKRKELSGGFRRTTNNRMELTAAITALQTLRSPCIVTLHTDSQYLVNSMMQGWAKRWRDNGWKRNKTDDAVNPDLWAKLLDLCETHKVTFEWVRGHAGDLENERCDRLSVQAAEGKGLPIDEGYESAHPDSETLFTETAEAMVKPPVTGSRKLKVTKVGHLCRRCGTPVIKQVPQNKRRPGQAYYYAYYLSCPNCKDMYMVEEAKRYI